MDEPPPPPRSAALYRLTHPPNGAARPAQCFLLAFSGCIFGSSGGVSASGGGGFLPSPAAASGFTVARYGNHKSWVFRHVSVRRTYIHRSVYAYILYVYYKGDAEKKKNIVSFYCSPFWPFI